ncbi:MAG: glycosyltransferase, partial [bacterium]|nr:glycosyltransferase [bacterium]
IGIGAEEDYRQAITDPDMWHPYRSFSVVAKRLMIPWVRPVYNLIAEHASDPGLVVVAPATAIGARIAQEKLGVPLATVHLQPVMLRSVVSPPVFGFPDILGHLPRALRGLFFKAVDAFLIDRLLAPETNAFRAELGLAPVERLFDHWLHSPELVIGFFPEWFAAEQPDWPPRVHRVGFPLYDESGARPAPAELGEFLDAGEAPVVFTAGSAMAQGEEFYRVSVEVCERIGRRGILLTQFPEQLPADLPRRVRHFEFVPFSEVLPRAAAFVHHGGIGSTAQALAAGVPQLVVPFAHDQPDNATRVKRLGVGELLLPRQYKAPRVAQRLNRLLDSDEIKDRCAKRAVTLRKGEAINRACELLEELR